MANKAQYDVFLPDFTHDFPSTYLPTPLDISQLPPSSCNGNDADLLNPYPEREWGWEDPFCDEPPHGVG